MTSLLNCEESSASIDEIKRLVAANPLTVTNTSGAGGRTALIEASVRSHREAVAFLLECGSDVHAVDDIGWTSLHWAA